MVFNAAVAFAIAAVPVQLPMLVTTILAWGTQSLARAGAIVKQLRSAETLGSVSAINADKTGTLTLNQMTAVQMAVAGRRYAVEGKGLDPGRRCADSPVRRDGRELGVSRSTAGRTLRCKYFGLADRGICQHPVEDHGCPAHRDDEHQPEITLARPAPPQQ